MKVVIVCESMFGNTEALADQVRDGLRDLGVEADVVEVADVQDEDVAGLDLLVIAAPTHALSLSRPTSRADAVSQGADPRRARAGVREWLADIDRYLPATAARPPVAVFDTRVLKTKHWPGSAAGRASRTLRHAGFQVIDRMSFYVEGLTGPLADGEGLRARDWGAELPESLRRYRVRA
ncbi:MAG: flavodoxin domain-containing protein [Propionibacteriales bacterium]|nr:flavodoxin domain-containing protein [Propionibacteriales bacterium]